MAITLVIPRGLKVTSKHLLANILATFYGGYMNFRNKNVAKYVTNITSLGFISTIVTIVNNSVGDILACHQHAKERQQKQDVVIIIVLSTYRFCSHKLF